MNRHWILAAAAIAFLIPASAQAQAPGGTRRVLERNTAGGQAPAVGNRIVLDTVETRVTPDRPYSAEAVTETVHVLGDGNRINRTSVTKVYRDSAGRTRRESVAENGTVRTITITDPVAHVSYSLDPITKTAYKRGGATIAATRAPGGVATIESGAPARAAVTAPGAPARVGATTVQEQPRSTAVRGSAVVAGTVVAGESNVQKEDLPLQNIEGVMATGIRTTTIIPAGQIGNAQEIRVVSERWFTDDLQLLVRTKHSDPRSGETTYRLRNILRAEPDPALFTVPADYTVQERNVRREQ